MRCRWHRFLMQDLIKKALDGEDAYADIIELGPGLSIVVKHG